IAPGCNGGAVAVARAEGASDPQDAQETPVPGTPREKGAPFPAPDSRKPQHIKGTSVTGDGTGIVLPGGGGRHGTGRAARPEGDPRAAEAGRGPRRAHAALRGPGLL